MRKWFMLLVPTLLILPYFSVEAGSYSAAMRRGNRYYKNEIYSEALVNYLEGKERNRRAIEPDFNAACAYYKLEDYVKSIGVLTGTFQNNQKGEEVSDIYYNMGNSYFMLGDWQNAVQSYIKGLEVNPYDLSLKYNLELALSKLKESRQQKSKQQSDGSERGGKKEKGESSPGTRGEEKRSESGSQQEPAERMNLTQEEAERLINSLGADQAETIGELIKSRINDEAHEKDW
jgi:tetratricopeptide (TPR) repeat protein